MKYLFSFSILFIWLYQFGTCQTFPSEVWHSGKLVTDDNQEYSGKIKYNMETDLVQLMMDGVTKTYSARTLVYFEILDAISNNYRVFYSIPFETTKGYKTPVIFEVLLEGHLTLLAREKIVNETTPISPYSLGVYSRRVLDFTYYFLDQKGNTTQYFEKKKDLLNIFSKKSALIKEYMKKNNLDYRKRADLIKITAYYNSILDS